MKPTIDVYYGAPLSIESEIIFLDRLICALQSGGESAVVFANVCTERNPHQIDFLVAASRCVCHIELKNYTAPVIGKVNGPWTLALPGGRTKRLENKNPYRQALDAKYAVSDAMREFAASNASIPQPDSGEQFYKSFESVVCIFPQLLPGSSIPSDHKVRTLGFDELTELILKRSRSPGWTQLQWIEFAMHLGLTHHDSDSAVELGAKELELVVDGYRQRCERYISNQLRALVPTTLSGPNGPTKSPELLNVLTQRGYFELIGESGTGKSHLARHITLAETHAGGVVVFVPARDYEGRLSALLNRSVAHLHPGTAVGLFDAATRAGARISVVLDGFNECPVRLRADLLKDLQALTLRWSVAVLITGQEYVDVSNEIYTRTYSMAELEQLDRETIFQCYDSHEPDAENLKLCEAFQTAYEISLAAEISSECGSEIGRTGLLDAYVRRKCEKTSHPELARHLLVAIADHLSANLKSSVTQIEFWQLAEQACTRFGARLQAAAELFSTGLLIAHQGRCSFRHELFEELLQAEALLRRNVQPVELAEVLCRPQYRRLATDVIGLASDKRAIFQVMRALADSTIITECLRGSCGAIAAGVASAECKNALDVSFTALDEITLEPAFADGASEELIGISGGVRLPPHVIAALKAVGSVLTDAMFLDRALALARQTDEACWSELQRTTGVVPSNASINAIYYWCFVVTRSVEDRVLPPAIIYHGLKCRFADSANPHLARTLTEMSGTLIARSPGELFLICRLLQNDTAPAMGVILELLRSCWETGIYNRRLEALHTAHVVACALDEQCRTEVGEFLSSLTPANPWLSGALVDALVTYGLVESPVSDNQATREIRELLCNPDRDESRKRAYGVVSAFFEDVFQGTYYSSFNDLKADDQRRFLVMAAQGATHEMNFHLSYILDRLLHQFDSRENLPAYQRWTAYPPVESFSPQEATASLLLGIAGCARHLDKPSSLGLSSTDDQRAWDIYAEIIFWILKPSTSREQMHANCEPLWQQLHVDLAFQALDPLERISTSERWPPNSASTLALLSKTFPEHVRCILEFGLKNHSRLTTVFAHPPISSVSGSGYLGFIIGQLAALGTLTSVPMLEMYLDSPNVGEAAAQSIKAVRSRYV
jgi:hypothetical protein